MAKTRSTKTKAAKTATPEAPAAPATITADAAPVKPAKAAKTAGDYRVTHGALVVGIGDRRTKGAVVAAADLTPEELAKFVGDGTLAEA